MPGSPVPRNALLVGGEVRPCLVRDEPQRKDRDQPDHGAEEDFPDQRQPRLRRFTSHATSQATEPNSAMKATMGTMSMPPNKPCGKERKSALFQTGTP